MLRVQQLEEERFLRIVYQVKPFEIECSAGRKIFGQGVQDVRQVGKMNLVVR